MVRLFFAALPDAATCERISSAARSLPLEPMARLVLRENVHMTVAFVGEVPAAQVPLLRDIGAAQRIGKFSLRFNAFEYWPKPEVVVTAARTVPPALQLLWQQLHARLAERGWALDPKRLRPHVTLARKVLQAPVLQAMSAFDWQVNEFSLMQSDTGGAQSAYTVVDTWSLLDDSEGTAKNSAI